MSLEDMSIEISRQLHSAQDKYTYFLLAFVAAAIAYAMKLTTGSVLSYSMIPLGFAILCWGISFLFGCRMLNYSHSNLYANGEALEIQRGNNPQIGKHPQKIEAACEGIRQAFESNNEKISFYGKWQFRFLIIGSLLFLSWHIIEMIIRTISK